MRLLKIFGIMVYSLVLTSCVYLNEEESMQAIKKSSNPKRVLTSVDDILTLFPKTISEISAYADTALKQVKERVEKLCSLSASERTFDNTVREFDDLLEEFYHVASALNILTMVSPDKAIREHAQAISIGMHQETVDLFVNPALYKAFQDYNAGRGAQDALTAEQQYFIDETIKGFKNSGLHLPEEKLVSVRALTKELEQLASNFEMNIAADQSKVLVDEQALDGLSDEFIAHLKKDGNMFVLTCDFPTYLEVMSYCTVEATRRDLYRAYNSRAMENIPLLHQISKKRDELAKVLGFASYAALNIDETMAGTVERVQTFLASLMDDVREKVEEEFVLLKGAALPLHVQLDDQEKFNPWDLMFVKESYKKAHFSIDENAIAEYFPAQKALDGMLKIYQDFLGLDFVMVKPAWVWDPEVQLIAVYDRQTKALLAYLFLDLYPRVGKYSHACHATVVRAQKRADGTMVPAVGAIIANFPKQRGDKPALLKFTDVTTFFHEFGHAMHDIVGRTEFAGKAGTSVKLDFVEVPSQMFEEWMYNASVIKKVSSHYQTGEPLPYDIIQKKIDLKQFDSGFFVQRQAWLALISLGMYQSGGCADSDALVRDLHQRYLAHVRFDPEAHFQASFGHLTGYGARYYSYLWSKVYALDLFYAIQRNGKIDPVLGKRFVEQVLAPGGSKDPSILLKTFLGREPNRQAFLHDLGINR